MHSTSVGLVDHALEGHESLKCECTYRCDVRVLAADRQQDLMHSEVTLHDRSNLHKAAPINSGQGSHDVFWTGILHANDRSSAM